jgi:NAD(P) transhydrogenase subunit beta
MNRPLTNILFKPITGEAQTGTAGVMGTLKEVSALDAASMLRYAQKVIIVPGYGMAVGQAQHKVKEMSVLLEEAGVEVKFAIHPVAGRMPGHMNVLLAEANVPYEKLFDMEQINEEFQRADVALVIGANDVTNPAARKDTTSPIYGMPILNVDQAQNIIVIKRSMKPGFAGIDNELYLDPKTGMLFGDAKEAVSRVVSELKKAA